jgi:hypothetical protein
MTCLELHLLVGPVEPPPCESAGHPKSGQGDVHGGPATHYARVHCFMCGLTELKAYCAPFVAYVQGNGLIECMGCGKIHPGHDIITILGPIR